MNLETRLRQLAALWPDLEWTTAHLLEYDHDVVMLDTAYVFRYECADPSHEPLEQEVRFLEALDTRGRLPVPRYTHVDDGYQVAGYPMLPGASVTPQLWNTLTRSQRRQCARGVAQVLDAIHGMDPGTARQLGIPEGKSLSDEIAGFLAAYIRCLRANALEDHEMVYCDSVVESMLSRDLAATVPRCPIHGDLEAPHLLHTGHEFTGVIDFGDVSLGDPAADIGSLWELGEEFIDDLLAAYSCRSEDIKRRSHWFWFGRALDMLSWSGFQRSGGLWDRLSSLFPRAEGV